MKTVERIGTSLLLGTALMAACSGSEATGPSSAPHAKIAFESDRAGGATNIYMMNADGTEVVNLTNNPGFFPAWSPDGAKIAFESGRDGNQDIYVMNADGTGQVNLTHNLAIDESPAWSPDGTKIAFVSTRAGNFDVYVMNSDGSSVTRLTNNSGLSPAWSPDGTKIAFASGGGNSEVYVMNRDGTGLVNLTNNPAADGHPVWRP